MRWILRQLPFFDEETTAAAPDGPVVVRAYQMVVWVSVTRKGIADLSAAALRVPAVLDTANNHNFSLQEDHLARWACLDIPSIPRFGQVWIGGQTVPLLELNVLLHCNRPGKRDDVGRGNPYCLELPEGLAVYPRGVRSVARLPTLGLRALVRSRLQLLVDGKRQCVSLRTSG